VRQGIQHDLSHWNYKQITMYPSNVYYTELMFSGVSHPDLLKYKKATKIPMDHSTASCTWCQKYLSPINSDDY